MLKRHIDSAIEFHRKFNLGVNERTQTGMFERNNLLLEEMGELFEAQYNDNPNEILLEALDVYYILMGNCAYLGIEELDIVFDHLINQFEFLQAASKLAQATRKRFEQDDYINEATEQMVLMIVYIMSLFDELEQFDSMFKEHHHRMMNKSAKIIGDVIVVSNFE